ncbi:MAG: orotate phosphoribosyltransferase [Clostridiaceae bacterium]|nr:orotate phosphoribosyltransferase [Clostridiaceae bacterium]
METRFREIKSRNNPLISIRVTPGHFATRHSHINFYVDMTAIKYQHKAAQLAARELADHYAQTIPVDTIVCLDGIEVVAAFLAAALSDRSSGKQSVNTGSTIAVVTPEINTSGQLMFRDNVQSMIWNRSVLLLVASATTGNTITQAIECIEYYSGRVSGICAVFSAIPKVGEIHIQAIFTDHDVPGYQTFPPADCPECLAHHKIDALVNSFGYSKL